VQGIPISQACGFLTETWSGPEYIRPDSEIHAATNCSANEKGCTGEATDRTRCRRRRFTISSEAEIEDTLLPVAVEGGSIPMVHLLLENKMNRQYVYKGRKVKIKGNTAEGDDFQVCS
jgi:hypothetical protein